MLNNDLSKYDKDPQNLFILKVSDLCEDQTEENNIGFADHTDFQKMVVFLKLLFEIPKSV